MTAEVVETAARAGLEAASAHDAHEFSAAGFGACLRACRHRHLASWQRYQ